MLSRTRIVFGLAVVAAVTTAIAEMYTIPADQVDGQKIYYGKSSAFEKAGEVAYDDVIKTTPEFKELKKEKIERGTGKYWILSSQASDRTMRAITEVGQKSEYDLIAAQGYLASLSPSIPSDDITGMVSDCVKGDDSKESKATVSPKKAAGRLRN